MSDASNDPGISFKQEITRKLVHLSSLWMPTLIFFWPFEKMFLFGFFGVCFVLNILCEYAYSMQVPIITPIYGSLFGNMLRKTPKRGTWIVSGSPPVFGAAALVCLIYPQFIASAAMTVMLTADTAAALFGRRFGKRKLNGNKSLEGSLAFVAVGVFCCIGIIAGAGELNWCMAAAAVIGVIIAALAELYRDQIRIDDNLSIPLLCGGCMSIAYYLI